MIKKTILDSGLVVLTENIPEFSSFALSYSLKSGSRAENLENNGIHHLIEHMIFKGSKKYNLKEIADISDRLGGQLNAFTGKEMTQYYIKTIDEKLRVSFDLLTDIVINSTFLADEFIKERSVVFQEIKESEDNPDTHAFETFYKTIFEKNALGYPIAGKEDQILSFERDNIYHFYKKKYKPEELLLAAVGNVNHNELVDMAQSSFSNFPSKKPWDFSFKKPEFNPKKFDKKNPSLKQMYVIIGFEGISFDSPSKYKFILMNDILGSGMSSKLFQKIREEKGLAYTISSFNEAFLECGMHIIYSIIEPAKVEEYLKAVRDEIIDLKNKGVTKDELERAKDHIKSSVIMGIESNISKMRSIVNYELYLKREFEVKEIIENINQASVDDINQLYKSYLNLNKAAIFLYGNIKGNKLKNFEFF